MEEAFLRAQLRQHAADRKSMPIRRWLLPLATTHVAAVTGALIIPDFHLRCVMVAVWLTSIGVGFVLSRKLPFILPEGEKFHNFIHDQVEAEAKELCSKLAILEKTAMTDPLTGLLNRRGGESSAAAHIARSKRNHLPVSLLFLDLDDFKKVNDQFGHMIGDLVLAKVAEVLRAHLRISDTVMRWGGEEFVVVLPDADLDGAVVAANKLRTSIQEIKFPGSLRVTASFGCAEIGDKGFTHAVSLADKYTYEAKTAGKNTVRPFPRKKLLDLVATRH